MFGIPQITNIDFFLPFHAAKFPCVAFNSVAAGTNVGCHGQFNSDFKALQRSNGTAGEAAKVSLPCFSFGLI